MTVRVAIIGYGTVGQGTARILTEHREEIHRKTGIFLDIASVCARTIHQKDTSFLPLGVQRLTDWQTALADPSVDVVAELIGGTDVAADVVRAALRAGRAVVTANKNLLAARGTELEMLAAKSSPGLHCEASVAGGIPVLAAIREGLAGDRIESLYGILNGTCNFILTTMESEGREMSDVLAEAQRLGYAEADPSADVEGFDARFKLAILARLAFGGEIPLASIPCQGITRVSKVDFEYAHSLGSTIRLLGAARRAEDGAISLFVRPMLIARSHMLAKVEGSYNAVWVKGARGGDTMYYGRGAGADPTGVSVVADIIRAARDLRTGARGRVPTLGFAEAETLQEHISLEGLPTAHYLRFVINDRPGILAALAGVCAKHDISIDAVIQLPHTDKQNLPFVITLLPAPNVVVAQAVAEMETFDFLREPPLHLVIAD
jgi:homoserine dehydrogenase